MPETITIKITCSKENKELETLRTQGLFFQRIADSLGISRDDIEELDD